MELHDDGNGVKDRILDDLAKSIKLVRRTLGVPCCTGLQMSEYFETKMSCRMNFIVNICNMRYAKCTVCGI